MNTLKKVVYQGQIFDGEKIVEDRKERIFTSEEHALTFLEIVMQDLIKRYEGKEINYLVNELNELYFTVEMFDRVLSHKVYIEDYQSDINSLETWFR